jgi:choline dehydrogenase-like flavoprotein
MAVNAIQRLEDRISARQAADIVVVGGGGAGCVIAARLSENPNLKVVLIEAGRDTPAGSIPDDIADIFPRSYANPNYFWPIEAVPRTGQSPVPFPQARVMGGGSSVMGMWAPRGLPADYDNWASYGVEGWSYRDLLPFFKMLERDLDFPGNDHGDDGPIPIMRRHRDSWPGFTAALGKAAEKRGVKFRSDLNGSEEDGLFEMPFSNDGHARFSSAIAYLTPDVRNRTNLEIITNTEVERLRFEGCRVVGVEFRRASGEQEYLSAAHVVVSAGAIHSPALLLRSGVGPAAELAALGIEPIIDSPKVGSNLQNHTCVHLGAVVQPEGRHDPAVRSYVLGCLRLSSGLTGAPPSDLFMGLISRSGPRARDIGLGMIAAALYSPFSRGRVSLANNAGKIKIDLALLEDNRDRSRMITAVKIARDLMRDPIVQAVTNETFLLPPKLPIKLLNQPGLKSDLFSIALSALLDTNRSIRRFTLGRRIGAGRFLDTMQDDDGLDDLIVSSATSMAHPAGTCALGSVVDSSTTVKGAERLFVADSSIMPKVPRANTYIPSVMVAEKAVFEIRKKISA